MFLSLRRVLFLVCHSWLYCLKRAVWVALLGVILSSMRLALSENDVGPDEGEEGNGSNSSIVPVCPTNVSCVELPVYCLDCTFDESCVYGNLTEAVCTPLESVECEVWKLPFRLASGGPGPLYCSVKMQPQALPAILHIASPPRLVSRDQPLSGRSSAC